MAQVQLLRPVLKRKFDQTSATAAVPETIQPPKLQQQQAQQQQAQQQSFALVYTLLHSSISIDLHCHSSLKSPISGEVPRTLTDQLSLTGCSNLFPNGCFEDSSFDAIRTDAEEYYRHRTSHGSIVDENKGITDPRNGILQGVLKQTTTAAQFCICADPTNRSNIIESYTFRFHYHGGRHLADLAVSGSSVSPTSIRSARSGLDELFRGISSSIEKMPDLPSESAVLRKAQWPRLKTLLQQMLDS
ncbi:MAG: hypothetical protein Q9221_000022 [Calogaya cf. arnoldii]